MYRSAGFILTAALFGIAIVFGPVIAPPLSDSLRGAPALQRTNPNPSPCTVQAQRILEPDTLLLGEEAKVTLRVVPSCGGADRPVDVVLVLDSSGFMAGDANREMKAAAKAFVEKLGLAASPRVRIGVVSFNSSARILCPLSNSEPRIKACITRVGADGGSAVESGMQEGLRVLLQGRRSVSDPNSIHEVMIVISNAPGLRDPGAVIRQAERVKGQGVLLLTICLGNDCDFASMQTIASDPRFAYRARTAAELALVFDQIHQVLLGAELKVLNIEDRLNPQMQIVNGSDAPPADIDPMRNQLAWETEFVLRTGISYTYRIKPLKPGVWPVGSDGKGRLRDMDDLELEFDIPNAEITVLSPIQPSPTGHGPPTATSLPNVTATPRPSPTQTATPAHGSMRYFPYAGRE